MGKPSSLGYIGINSDHKVYWFELEPEWDSVSRMFVPTGGKVLELMEKPSHDSVGLLVSVSNLTFGYPHCRLKSKGS